MKRTWKQRQLENARRAHLIAKLQKAGAIAAFGEIVSKCQTWNRRQGVASRLMFSPSHAAHNP